MENIIENNLLEQMQMYLINLLSEFVCFSAVNAILNFLLCKFLPCPLDECCSKFRNYFRAVKGREIVTQTLSELTNMLLLEQESLRFKILTLKNKSHPEVVRSWACENCGATNNFLGEKCLGC